MKKCHKCGQSEPKVEFAERSARASGKQSWCKECNAEYSRDYYQANKDKFAERRKQQKEIAREFVRMYLLAHPCSECGNGDSRVLDFHHVEEKAIEISNAVRRGWSISRISDEIDKCVVLCANCHRIHHAGG